MARAAYIVFSQSGSIDEATNGISFFNVIEGVEGSTPIEGEKVPPGTSLGLKARLVATWMKEEGDTPDVKYEGEIICTSPKGTPIFAGEFPAFSFAENIHFQRITIKELYMPGFPEMGMYIIEARLRREGQTDWIARQTYPFHIRMANEAPSDPAS